MKIKMFHLVNILLFLFFSYSLLLLFFSLYFFLDLFYLDSALLKRILREAHEELFEREHPDPYVCPIMPGGSSFMRNPAIPLEIVYPTGIPEHYKQ